MGIDFNAGNSAIFGVDAGYLSNNVHDNQFGDSAKGNGWTAGAYAVYDPGAFFVKGVTTYSSLNGNSTRHINFAGLATGATFAATPTGSPDVKMWTFGLHGGARLPMSATSVLTPYLNYDYVNAKLDGFDENNGNGAGLTVDSSKSNHSFLTGGVKWATQMGGVVPEVNLGYRYRFGSSYSKFHGWFTPDPANDFDIVSASQKKGTFLAGLSVGGKMGPVDVRIGYEGEFNGDVTSHSGNFKFVASARRSCGSAAAAAGRSSAAAATTAASGNPDLPGRLGDRCDGNLPAASAAAPGAGRARRTRPVSQTRWVGAGCAHPFKKRRGRRGPLLADRSQESGRSPGLRVRARSRAGPRLFVVQAQARHSATPNRIRLR